VVHRQARPAGWIALTISAMSVLLISPGVVGLQAVRLAAGELKLRLVEERRRREVGTSAGGWGAEAKMQGTAGVTSCTCELALGPHGDGLVTAVATCEYLLLVDTWQGSIRFWCLMHSQLAVQVPRASAESSPTRATWTVRSARRICGCLRWSHSTARAWRCVASTRLRLMARPAPRSCCTGDQHWCWIISLPDLCCPCA
jgi:hypothetical protein